ncbi:MAG TPA: sigma-54 dependent transcriptional regulator [Thermodesulfovibrionia bacterium]|nr:sigma-54 dependent transcriptional regulator [Thermodesulfovibrionia bacterium]
MKGEMFCAKVLIIDDDKLICNAFSRVISQMGHIVTCAHTLEDGLKQASAFEFDVVLLDVRMPDGNGLELIPNLHATASCPEVIIITGAGDPDSAELAIKSGAWDYIEKPTSIKEMTLPLLRAIQYRQEKRAVRPSFALKVDGIIGKSQKIKACFDLLAQASNSNANVLITGETGTGKELFARAIHENSSRRSKSFVVVDCAAMPGTLIESILFGHERGAFTGADRAQEGLIKLADHGTLFLDEVGELPLALQKALLRVLQEHVFRPLGGKQEVSSDFRLVSATNRNLNAMVREGTFREDLLFRLQALTIELPSLRDRPDDIKELALHYCAQISEKYGTGTKGLSPDFMDVLVSHEWSGNVRELVNTLERAIASAPFEPTLYAKHLPENIRIKAARNAVSKEHCSSRKNPLPCLPEVPPPVQSESPLPDQSLPSLQEFRNTTEQRYLENLMDFTKGNIKESCRVSGLSRSRLYALLQKYKIDKTG